MTVFQRFGRGLAGALVGVAAGMVLPCAVIAQDDDAAQPKAVDGKVAKRGEALGFAGRLSSDVDLVLGVRNLGDVVSAIVGSTFLEKIDAMAQSQGSSSFRDDPTFQQVVGMVQGYVGKDAFVALGEGSAESFRALNELNAVYSRINMQALAATALGGFAQDPGEMTMKMVAAEADAWLPILEKTSIPGVLVGSRITEGLDDVIGQLLALEGELPPQVVVADHKVPGAGEFRLWSLNLKDVFTEEHRGMLGEVIPDPELAKRIEAIVDGKKVEVAFGKVADYLVISFGENRNHLKFAEHPGASLVSRPEFDFVDPWLDKKLLAYSYAEDAVLSSLNRPEDARMMAEVAVGMLEDMQKQSGLDWSKARDLIKRLGDQMVELSQADYTSSVGLAMIDEGLRLESRGGMDSGWMDGEAGLKLARGLPEDAFLKFSAVAAPDYQKKSLEMLKTLGQTAYEVARAVSHMDGMEEFKQQFEPLDQRFRPDLLKIWEILETKYMAGLGRESALVVDLKGSMPKVPQLPRVLVNKGKVPRVAAVTAVVDRAKLTETWEQLVPAVNALAAKIPGQEPGAEFQLPDTLTSEKDGLKTHFFGLPFVSNDFLPSVSINDRLFFLSTSKNLSESIAGRLTQDGEAVDKGMAMEMNFGALRSFANEWLNLVLENGKEVFGGNEFAAADFKENAGIIRFALELSEVLHFLKVNAWSEAGVPRVSAHLKITDVGR